jgi:hypothetical protein
VSRKSVSQQNTLFPTANRKPRYKWSGSRQKNSLPIAAHGKNTVCCEPFVADGKMLFCREQLTAKSFFAASLFSGLRGNDLHHKLKTNFEALN